MKKIILSLAAFVTTAMSFSQSCPVPSAVPYSEDFTNYVPTCWDEATGLLTNNSVLSYVGGSSWTDGAFGFVGSNSAYLNLYDDYQYDWLLSPNFDLGNGSTAYQAEFDIALTEYDESFPGSLGADDTVAFVISTDGGATWSSTNILNLWDAANNTLTNTGTHIVVNLSSYTDTVMFGFYGGSSIDIAVDNDLFISKELYAEYATKHGVPTAGDIVITAIGTIGNSYIVREEDRFYFKDASVLWLKRTSDVESK